jgi:pyridoxamine 5'-phosphate oxidase
MALGGITNINQPHIPDFSNPFGLLVHCHEKIEGQLKVLERAAQLIPHADVRLLPELFAKVEAACAHFAVAGIKHTADEEESLFPRLRSCGAVAGREALDAMQELESQHRTAEQLHLEFDNLIARLPRDGSADSHDLDSFNELTTELTSFYRPHIELENNLVFPVAQRVLSPAEIHAIGQEMRERRRDILPRVQFTHIGS